jgi:maltose O-acetyltransferase
MNPLLRLTARLWHRGATLHEEYRMELLRQRHQLHPDFRLFEGARVSGPGKLVAGAGSYFGVGSQIRLEEGTTLTVGVGSHLGQYLRMATGTLDADEYLDRATMRLGDITIGDGVWVGANCFIAPGVTIGNHAVVGANSAVTKDVQDFEIVGGVPARHIRFKACRP